MRLRPDRIIIGEVRGGEALALLKAWNTRHPGGVTTIHSSSARSALTRLSSLVQEAGVPPQPELIAETINVIAFIARTPDGRRVTEVVRIDGYDPHNGFQLVPLAADDPARATNIFDTEVEETKRFDRITNAIRRHARQMAYASAVLTIACRAGTLSPSCGVALHQLGADSAALGSSKAVRAVPDSLEEKLSVPQLVFPRPMHASVGWSSPGFWGGRLHGEISANGEILESTSADAWQLRTS
jgi:hypothetical protein